MAQLFGAKVESAVFHVLRHHPHFSFLLLAAAKYRSRQTGPFAITAQRPFSLIRN
jgi:hypothetical protein